MKKVKLLYNPKAGGDKISAKLDLIFKKYQKAGYLVYTYRLDESLDLDIVFEDISMFEHILIAGGDGTLDIVINYMQKNNIDAPIGILPTGTANDFAKVLNIPMNLNKAIDNILHHDIKEIDLGAANDQYFINVAVTGMFSDVSQNTNTKLKGSLGKVAYFIKGLENAVKPKSYHIKIESNEFNYSGKVYLILILNGKTAGNINLSSNSQIDDGLLDVIVFKSISSIKTFSDVIDIIKGLNIQEYPGIIRFKTKELYIDGDSSITTDIDGERGPELPLSVKCIKKKLKIKGIL